MTAPRYDLLGVGNAIVDVIATTDDKFLEWLKDAANRLVNALRPRLAAWARESDLASG